MTKIPSFKTKDGQLHTASKEMIELMCKDKLFKDFMFKIAGQAQFNVVRRAKVKND